MNKIISLVCAALAGIGVANALDYPVVTAGEKISAASDVIDYTRGNAIWFDTPTSSSLGQAWKINDFSATSTNPDEVWERQSLPIGNGSFGGSVLGSVGCERVVQIGRAHV